MKQIILLLVVSACFSCRQQPAGNHYADLIKGDWVELIDTSDHEHSQPNYLCVEDSIFVGGWSDFFSYRLVADTIYTKLLPKEDSWSNDSVTHRYTIVKLTADTLVMQFAQKDTTDKTVILSKIHPKNNITPSTIYFASTGCFGECPAMYLEIDSSRNIRFYGDYYTSKKGGYRGKLPKAYYEAILSKIRELPLNTLKRLYIANWTDDATYGVNITNGDSSILSSAYGHDQEPIELHILFRRLLNVYKYVDMQPDTSVNKDYFLQFPILPGVEPEKIKFIRPEIIND